MAPGVEAVNWSANETQYQLAKQVSQKLGVPVVIGDRAAWAVHVGEVKCTVRKAKAHSTLWRVYPEYPEAPVWLRTLLARRHTFTSIEGVSGWTTPEAAIEAAKRWAVSTEAAARLGAGR